MSTSDQVFQVAVLEDNLDPSTLASAEPRIHGRPRVFEPTVPAPSGPSGPEREEQLEADDGAPVATIVNEQEMATPSTHGGNDPISRFHENVGHDVGSSSRRMERSPGYVRRKAPDELGDRLRKCEKINRRPTAQEAESQATQNREASNESIGPSSNRIPVQATTSLDSTLHSYDEVNHPRPTSQNADSATTQNGISSNENNMPSSHRNPRSIRFDDEPMLGSQTRERVLVSIDTILHSFDDANHPAASTQNAETPNENVIENRDPSLAPPHSMRRHNSSFLSVLDTMMHMFHLEGNSEQEIETFFDNQGFYFHLLFIHGVVDVRMPPGVERELVEKCIEERLRVFELILRLNRSGRTAEEIRELCFHTGGCVLDLVSIGRKEDDPEQTSVHIYRTDMEFVEDLIFLSNTHPE